MCTLKLVPRCSVVPTPPALVPPAQFSRVPTFSLVPPSPQFSVVPTFVRDFVYVLVAKYRYKIFGRCVGVCVLRVRGVRVRVVVSASV